MPSHFDPPRIERLAVRNFRVLKDIVLDDLTPLTVLLGPNGSGKSTVFDVFAFLAECFSDGLRKAWDRRGRFRELRSRDQDGPISIELHYREAEGAPLIAYFLEIDEKERAPVVSREWLGVRTEDLKALRAGAGFLDYAFGRGSVVVGEGAGQHGVCIERELSGPDVLAASTFGTLAEHPRIIALRRFVLSWHLSSLAPDAGRGHTQAGAEERLSPTGSNLPNVIQYLHEQHPERLAWILDTLRRRIPRIEKIEAEVLQDSRLLLLVKDAPFSSPVLSRFVSDGTLKMLAWLTLLHDPEPSHLVGIEEPENYLHPRLLPELAEECQQAAERTQLIVTTHSPFFMDRLQPEEVRVFHRGADGYTLVRRVADMPGVQAFLNHGASLGELWMEGHFDVGDPLATELAE